MEPLKPLTGPVAFVRGLLGLLTGFSLLVGALAWVIIGFQREQGVSAGRVLLYAHAALPLLSWPASTGMLFRRRWAWWLGLATFGLLAAMSSFVLVQIAWPRPPLPGLRDPSFIPLAGVYGLLSMPGVVLLRPGREYEEEFR